MILNMIVILKSKASLKSQNIFPYLDNYFSRHQCRWFRPCFRPYLPNSVTLQNLITEIAKDLSTTLSSFAAPKGQDSTRAAGTF